MSVNLKKSDTLEYYECFLFFYDTFLKVEMSFYRL